MPRAKNGQQKVSTFKKTTGLCSSIGVITLCFDLMNSNPLSCFTRILLMYRYVFCKGEINVKIFMSKRNTQSKKSIWIIQKNNSLNCLKRCMSIVHCPTTNSAIKFLHKNQNFSKTVLSTLQGPGVVCLNRKKEMESLATLSL